PPSSPAARDQGPRLVPLHDRAKEASRLGHCLDLADSALGRGRKNRETNLNHGLGSTGRSVYLWRILPATFQAWRASSSRGASNLKPIRSRPFPSTCFGSSRRRAGGESGNP